MSAEGATSLTLALAALTAGSTAPPVFIFRRVHFRAYFLMMLVQVVMLVEIELVEWKQVFHLMERFISCVIS